MKTKLIGLGILAAVIIAAVAYVFISNHQTITEINGYVGGEKIGLLEDEEVQKILHKCGMSAIYIENPYECFLLMCLLTDCPLAVFADIWEMSYEDTDGEISEEKS